LEEGEGSQESAGRRTERSTNARPYKGGDGPAQASGKELVFCEGLRTIEIEEVAGRGKKDTKLHGKVKVCGGRRRRHRGKNDQITPG